jgi:hypothetical protein
MVESICGQGFTYAREVEKKRQKVVKLELEKTTGKTAARRLKNYFFDHTRHNVCVLYIAGMETWSTG